MVKVFLIIIFLPLLIACPKSKLHSNWQDSSLTKKKYLKQKIAQAEYERTLKDNTKSTVKRILNPEW